MYQTDITKWYDYARLRRMAHSLAAEKADKLNSIIGFSAIFAGIISGIEVVHGTTTDDAYRYLVIVIGVFAILAGILNASMKFFGFESLKQRHHTASSQYAVLQYEIERWLMTPDEKIPDEIYDRISAQLAETDKSAPLLKTKALDKAKKTLKEQPTTEIPICHSYNVELTEDYTVENGRLTEIKGNPVRSYKCESLELCQSTKTNDFTINQNLIMTREGNDSDCIIKGDGRLDNNIGFIRYTIRNNSNDNVTSGTMVIIFTNRVEAEGYWMTAGVKGNEFLVGRIRMNLLSNPIHKEPTEPSEPPSTQTQPSTLEASS